MVLQFSPAGDGCSLGPVLQAKGGDEGAHESLLVLNRKTHWVFFQGGGYPYGNGSKKGLISPIGLLATGHLGMLLK